MYIQLIVNVVVAIAAWYVFFKRGPKKGKALPGPTGLPIIGYAYKLSSAPHVFNLFSELAQKYGGIFHFKSFGEDAIVLNDADIVRSLLSDKEYNNFTNDRPYIFWTELVVFQSKGIIGAKNIVTAHHGELRKNFVRGMHVYGEGISTFEAVIMSELVKVNEQLESFNGEEFDMQTIIKNFLYSFISVFLSGEPVKDEQTRQMFWDFDSCTDYLVRTDVNFLLSKFPLLRNIPGSPYKRPFDAMIHAKEALLQKYMYDAKKSYQPSEIRGLVDFYLNEQRLTKKDTCNDEQVCAVVLETVFAGVITTLSHLSSYFLCLMNYPKYQKKIQEEIDRVIGKHGQPSLTDRHTCEFTEAVTLEVHRYLTAVMVPGPHMCNEHIEFRGYDIPKDSTILTNLWFIHHDEKVWGDPWMFRPERWLDDNGALLPNDHVLRKNFLAFGTGRRGCIGKSLARSRAFLFVTTLLQRLNFEMSPENAKSCDHRDGDIGFQITCRPKPYLCRAVPRKRVGVQDCSEH